MKINREGVILGSHEFFKAEFSLVVSFNLKIADVSKRSHLLGVYLQGHFAPQLLSHSQLQVCLRDLVVLFYFLLWHVV